MGQEQKKCEHKMGGDVELYGYEWTDEYGIFRLSVAAKIQKEIRPVFREELDFFGMDEFWDYPKDTDMPLLWAEGIRRYVLNGVSVADAVGGVFYTKPVIKRLTEDRLKLQPIDIARLYEVNRELMVSLEQKAVHFIQEQYEKYKKEGYAFVCAFSGGKDSLVLLDLCAKALAPKDFYVIFSNTGMELSDTLKAVEKAKKRYPQLNFAEAKCHMDPSESWEEFGPPGRRMRWCCSVHKSVPTILKLREILGNYNAKAIVYDGVRAEESARRANYGEIVIGAKSISQINCHPILKWNTAELYSYLFFTQNMLNDAYKIGLFRVGCKVCPMSSEWWDGIANNYYADEIKTLVEKVENYAKSAKSEAEAKDYVESGGWHARLGGKGLPNGGNRIKETIENNSIMFAIRNAKQKWEDVTKILGTTVENYNGTLIQKINNYNYEFKIKNQDDIFKISYKPPLNMDRFVISKLRGVANKVAYCIGCKTCVVQCPTGPFNIQNGKIVIRENSCIHCKNCIDFSPRGCLVADNLRVPEGGFMNMKGLDPYHHFGIRQAWLSHFMEEGVNCFSQTVLGTIQYSALKVWLKEACIIEMVKAGKTTTISETKLSDKLKKFGAYNPFTWAIIWVNLAYNSTISHWYCLNIDIGSSYEKSDLVNMLGENFSKANRENAITALNDVFRNSPIGDALKQGIQVDKSYLRAGWDYPDAVALLYALYLYGEKTGHKAFTFGELVNSGKNPDAVGVSPHDIFGIDPKTFKENVQGLAIEFPKYIRVSLVANLDNIVLEDFSSLDILDLYEE